MNLEKQEKNLDVNSVKIKRIISNKLNELCEFLDNLYDINNGGCCYITYCLAYLLEKDGFNFKIVIYDDTTIRRRKFSKLEHNYTHYGILLGNYFINHIDTYGLTTTKFSKVKSTDILNHYQDNNWNYMYNAHKNSFLFNTLESFYNDFTKDL